METLPASSADEGKSYLPAGLHKLKVVSITDWTDKDGKVKTDDRGWPGLTVTLKNKDGIEVTFNNYYCNVGMNDPKRTNENTRCKSDYFLTKFKNALGFGQEEVPMNKIIGKFVWMPVVAVYQTHADGSPYMKDGKQLVYHELDKVFFPDAEKDGTKISYAMPGDPLIAGQELGGIFKRSKVKKDTTTASATSGAAAPPAGHSPTAETQAGPDADF
jgi:hypothetical protein